MYVNFYGRFYGKVDACANCVYQALSPPPLKGPGDEARSKMERWLATTSNSYPNISEAWVDVRLLYMAGGSGRRRMHSYLPDTQITLYNM